jgi:hypothetical protein
MRKWLVIVALALGAMLSTPRQAAQVPAQSSDNTNHQSQGNQSTRDRSPVLVNTKKQAAKPSGGLEEPADDEKEHSVKLTSLPPVTLNEKPKTFRDQVLDWGPWISNFLLVGVGGLQVWLLLRTWQTIERQANIMQRQAADTQESSAEALSIAKRQAELTREQAELMKSQADLMARQTDIQEANMSQWVEAAFLGVGTRELTKVPNSNAIETAEIDLQGQVVNRTPLPMTIQKVVTEISRALEWEEFETAEEILLPPIKDGIESSYPFFVSLALTQDQTQALLRHDLQISALVRVSFTEASRKSKEQSFPLILRCSPHAVETLRYMGKAPTKKAEHRSEKTT